MRAKEIQDRPPGTRLHGVRPAFVLGILLIIVVLSLGDLMKAIAPLAPVASSSFFSFFSYGIDETLATGVVLFATYKYGTRPGVAAILLFVATHIPAIISSSEDSSELTRTFLAVLVTLLGIWIIDRLRKIEERLRTAEAQSRTTLDNMLDGCQIIGFDWRYVYVNDSAAKQGKRNKEELLGHTMMEMNPGIEDTDMFANLRSCMETRFPHHLENLFTFANGSQKWFEFNMQPVPEGVFILSSDITERRWAEQEINLLSTIITRVTGESQSFDEATKLVLSEVCKSTDWDLGEAWFPSHDGKILECSPTWCGDSNRLEEFRQISEELTLLPNQGLPGRIWASKQSEFISDVSLQPERIFKRAQVALKAGLKAGVGVPVIADERVVAVLVFFMRKFREEDGQLIRLVSDVVAQLGLVFQRKQAETELRESEAKYRNLVDNALTGVYRTNLEGDILYVNNALVRIIGLNSAEELIAGGALVRYKSPSDRAVFVKELTEKGKVNSYEAELVTKTGEIKDVIMTGVLEGDTISGMIMDITEHKKSEDKIAHLASFPELNPSPILELDNKGNLGYLNPACKSIFPDLSTLGMSHPILGNWPQALKELQNSNWNKLIVREVKVNGSLYEQTITPVGKEHVHIYVRDITERKKMQEQLIAQDRLASIGQIVAGVAHEINNPLTSVIGFSDLLLQRDLPSDVKGDLKIVNDEAHRTSKIVKGLLAFARKQPEKKEPIDINAQVKIIIELSNHRHKVNNIQVNTHFAEDLPQITANGSQLQQVFLNIVMNAEQAMLEAHSRGIITITTEMVGNIVRVSFADDGPGISPENMKKLFTPFFTTKEVGKGTGLGLSICHGIITEHGGRIYAESEPGKGATFIIELPVIDTAPGQETAE